MRLLLLSSTLWVVASTMRKPDLYVWLEQNSYICDLSSGGIMPRFLSPDESKQFNCACGDPLISQAACARKGNEMPTCHSIPDLCMREYAILFTETSDRLAQPIPTDTASWSTTRTSSPSSANPTIIPIKYTTAKQNPIQKASACQSDHKGAAVQSIQSYDNFTTSHNHCAYDHNYPNHYYHHRSNHNNNNNCNDNSNNNYNNNNHYYSYYHYHDTHDHHDHNTPDDYDHYT
ncbi:unnamed protein product [Nippostrongylus brasiliensis]|uniref:Secreted protein n=1 Tax=Nippostrongylus brasiliensis TaxID=27835 RepID=A0A158QXT9_NIPBR|nr:unnamed protein product [Nippostrongylus brasiliensis]